MSYLTTQLSCLTSGKLLVHYMKYRRTQSYKARQGSKKRKGLIIKKKHTPRNKLSMLHFFKILQSTRHNDAFNNNINIPGLK